MVVAVLTMTGRLFHIFGAAARKARAAKSHLFYWAMLRLQVILLCCPGLIVISILISCRKLFEQIKMMMSMMPLVAVVVFIYAIVRCVPLQCLSTP